MSPEADARSSFAPFAAWAFAAWTAVTAGWWALAFAPLPVPSAWLAEARSVCFGTLPNGMPDTWGWMLLVLGPLSMLGFLVIVWGGELLASARWMARRRLGAALLVGLALSASAALAAVAARVVSAEQTEIRLTSGPDDLGPLPAGYPRSSEAAPELGLVDPSGERVDLAALAGRPAVVTFAFAHCVTVCPTLVATLRRTTELVPAGVEPQLLGVTLDPWRDTPRSLPDLMSAWGLDSVPDARVLSGGIEEVVATHDRWGIEANRDEKTGDIVHPAMVFVVDPQGRLAYRFLSPSPRWLADALTRIAAEPT
jgi:protein SCO1/2